VQPAVLVAIGGDIADLAGAVAVEHRRAERPGDHVAGAVVQGARGGHHPVRRVHPQAPLLDEPGQVVGAGHVGEDLVRPPGIDQVDGLKHLLGRDPKEVDVGLVPQRPEQPNLPVGGAAERVGRRPPQHHLGVAEPVAGPLVEQPLVGHVPVVERSILQKAYRLTGRASGGVLDDRAETGVGRAQRRRLRPGGGLVQQRQVRKPAEVHLGGGNHAVLAQQPAVVRRLGCSVLQQLPEQLVLPCRTRSGRANSKSRSAAAIVSRCVQSRIASWYALRRSTIGGSTQPPRSPFSMVAGEGRPADGFAQRGGTPIGASGDQRAHDRYATSSGPVGQEGAWPEPRSAWSTMPPACPSRAPFNVCEPRRSRAGTPGRRR